MTIEASIQLERTAAQVREDALLLDFVQSTPIRRLLDICIVKRADAVVAEFELFLARESYRHPTGVPTAVNSPVMTLAAVASTSAVCVRPLFAPVQSTAAATGLLEWTRAPYTNQTKIDEIC